MGGSMGERVDITPRDREREKMIEGETGDGVRD